MNYKKYAKELEEIISRISLDDSTRVLVNHLCLMSRDKCEDGMTRYVRVDWPEYQYFMNHKRWNECLLTDDNAYMIPDDLYEEVTTGLS